MTVQLNRRQFLGGDLRGRAVAIRPPWSMSEAAFVDTCDRCGRCIEACGVHLIKAGSGGFPELDFTAGECTFCSDCVNHCPTGALASSYERAHWASDLTISEDCLALRGVDCRVCGEQCEHTAIRFVPVLRSVAKPHLEREACTGCGACIGPCPTSALRFSVNKLQGNPQP